MLPSVTRILKRLLTLAAAGSTSVFIAACYGAPNAFERLRVWTIKTSDAAGAPIRGIRLTVRDLRQAAAVAGCDTLYTDSAGVAEFTYLRPEGETLAADSTFVATAEDVDGADNGGPYRAVERGLPNGLVDTVRITMVP